MKYADRAQSVTVPSHSRARSGGAGGIPETTATPQPPSSSPRRATREPGVFSGVSDRSRSGKEAVSGNDNTCS